MNLKNLFLVAILGVVLLASASFIVIPENKTDKIASNKADFTLNSKPKILFNLPEGEAPSVFIEPIDSSLAGGLLTDAVLGKEIKTKLAPPPKPVIKKNEKKIDR